MRRIPTIIAAILVFISVQATTPARELRSTWLTTVWSIDWPKTQINNSNSATQINAQKAELTAILDTMKACGFNAIFFQIRGMSDVMYPTQYENWSAYLTGTRGKNPGYDPLLFAITEAHARGMELHAWLNPYRYSSSSSTYGTLSTDYSNTHPDWILDYGSYSTILNPGLPEVRHRIKQIIGEIINNYDVDGIVFDDYFYAYGGTPTTLDAATQRLYKPANKSVGDWRRENVNKMIKAVYDTIQAIKPYVKFGVSPFGTWTTNESVATSRGITLPQGVGLTGNMYEEIYCDPIAWLEEGTVDYISPQLYWTSTSIYPYGILANWWSGIASQFGRHFYSSHSTSSLSGAPAATKQIIFRNDTININALSMAERGTMLQAAAQAATQTTVQNYAQNDVQTAVQKSAIFAPSEVEIQVNFNRQYDLNNAPGSVFYNTTNTLKFASMRNIFKNTLFNEKTITPHINWKSTAIPASPTGITLSGNTLSWQRSDTLYRTAVYIIPSGNSVSSSTLIPGNLQGIYYGTTCNITATTGDIIALTSVDRYGAESAPSTINWGSNSGNEPTETDAPLLIYPAEGSEPIIPCNLVWHSSSNAIRYEVQLSNDINFSNIVFDIQTGDTLYNLSNQHTLQNGTTYYWRVKSISIGSESEWSSTYNFTPKKFGIITPTDGETGISTECTIEWDSIISTAQYKLEISSKEIFISSNIVYETTTTSVRHTIPEGVLNIGYVYYARVSITAGDLQAVSDVISFTTATTEIPIPVITAPTEGEIIEADSVTIEWNKQKSNGFRVEISQDATFPGRQTTGRITDNTTYHYTFSGLENGVWYTRIKAKTTNGYTEYSDTISFTIGIISATDYTQTDDIYLIQPNRETIEILSKRETFEESKITIIGINGIQLTTTADIQNRNEKSISVNISNLPEGIYILKIKTKNGEKICRFKK